MDQCIDGLMDGQLGGHVHAWMEGRKEGKEGRIYK